MPTDVELVGRLVGALALGAAIGLERELNGQAAGLRTHMTVARGAALFAAVSAYGFGEFHRPRAETNFQVDVTRVASNIVTGVGFLGGGAIIKNGSAVRGLTTAASLWVTAAVGLAVALGSYLLAVTGTAGLLLSLGLLRAPRCWIRRRARSSRRRGESQESVVVRVRRAADTEPFVAALGALPGLEVSSVSLQDNECEIVLETTQGPRSSSTRASSSSP